MSKQKSLQYYVPGTSDKMLESLLGKPVALGEDYIVNSNKYIDTVNQRSGRGSDVTVPKLSGTVSDSTHYNFDLFKPFQTSLGDDIYQDPDQDIPTLTMGELQDEYWKKKSALNVSTPTFEESEYLQGFSDDNYAENVRKAIRFHSELMYHKMIDPEQWKGTEGDNKLRSKLLEINANDPAYSFYIKPADYEFVMGFAEKRARTQSMLDEIFNNYKLDRSARVFGPDGMGNVTFINNGAPFKVDRTFMGDVIETMTNAWGWTELDKTVLGVTGELFGADVRRYHRLARLHRDFGAEKNVDGMVDPGDKAAQFASGFVVEQDPTGKIPVRISYFIPGSKIEKKVDFIDDPMVHVIFSKFLESYVDPTDSNRSVSAKIAKGVATFAWDLPLMYAGGAIATAALKPFVGMTARGLTKYFPEAMRGLATETITKMVVESGQELTKSGKFVKMVGNGAYSTLHSYINLMTMGMPRTIDQGIRHQNLGETLAHHAWETAKFSLYAGVLRGVASKSSQLFGGLLRKLPAGGVSGFLRTNPQVINAMANVAEGFALGMSYGDINNLIEGALGNAVYPEGEDQAYIDGMIFGIFNGLQATMHFSNIGAAKNYLESSIKDGRNLKPVMVRQDSFGKIINELKQGKTILEAVKDVNAKEGTYYVREKNGTLREIDADKFMNEGIIEPDPNAVPIENAKGFSYLVETMPYQRFAALRSAMEDVTLRKMDKLMKKLIDKEKLYPEGTEQRKAQDMNLRAMVHQYVLLERYSLADNALKNNSIKFLRRLTNMFGKQTADPTKTQDFQGEFFDADVVIRDVIHPYLNTVATEGIKIADQRLNENPEFIKANTMNADGVDIVYALMDNIRAEVINRNAKGAVDYQDYEIYPGDQRDYRVAQDNMLYAYAAAARKIRQEAVDHFGTANRSREREAWLTDDDRIDQLVNIMARTRPGEEQNAVIAALTKAGLMDSGPDGQRLTDRIVEAIKEVSKGKFIFEEQAIGTGLRIQEMQEQIKALQTSVDEGKATKQDVNELHRLRREIDLMSRDLERTNNKTEEEATWLNFMINEINKERFRYISDKVRETKGVDVDGFNVDPITSFSDIVDKVRQYEEMINHIRTATEQAASEDTLYAKMVAETIKEHIMSVDPDGTQNINTQGLLDALFNEIGTVNPNYSIVKDFLTFFMIDKNLPAMIKYHDFHADATRQVKEIIKAENAERVAKGLLEYTEKEIKSRTAELIAQRASRPAYFDVRRRELHLNSFFFSDAVMNNPRKNNMLRAALAQIGASRGPEGLFKIIMHELSHGAFEQSADINSIYNDQMMGRTLEVFNRARGEALRMFPGLLDGETVRFNQTGSATTQALFRTLYKIFNTEAFDLSTSMAEAQNSQKRILSEFLVTAFTDPVFANWLQTVPANGELKDPINQMMMDAMIKGIDVSNDPLYHGSSIWDVMSRAMISDGGGYLYQNRNSLEMLRQLANIHLGDFIEPVATEFRPRTFPEADPNYFDITHSTLKSDPFLKKFNELYDQELGRNAEPEVNAEPDPVPEGTSDNLRNMSFGKDIQDAVFEDSGPREKEEKSKAINAFPIESFEKLKAMLGEKLYEGATWEEITYKETLQNSFDAIKRKYLSKYEKSANEGRAYFPIIRHYGEVLRESREGFEGLRTSTYDNGVGMSLETLRTSFFEVFGSDKGIGAFSGTGGSGGFGIAKIAYLYSSNGMYVITKKDGKVSLGRYVPPGETFYQIEGEAYSDPGASAHSMSMQEAHAFILREFSLSELMANVAVDNLDNMAYLVRSKFDEIIDANPGLDLRYGDKLLIEQAEKDIDFKESLYSLTEIKKEMDDPDGSFTYSAFVGKSKEGKKVTNPSRSYSSRDTFKYMDNLPMFFEHNNVVHYFKPETAIVAFGVGEQGDPSVKMLGTSSLTKSEGVLVPRNNEVKSLSLGLSLNSKPNFTIESAQEGRSLHHGFYGSRVYQQYTDGKRYQDKREELSGTVYREYMARKQWSSDTFPHAKWRYNEGFPDTRSGYDTNMFKNFQGTHFEAPILVDALKIPSGTFEFYYIPIVGKNASGIVDGTSFFAGDNNPRVTYKIHVYSEGVWQFSKYESFNLPDLGLKEEELKERYASFKDAQAFGINYNGAAFIVNLRHNVEAGSDKYPIASTRQDYYAPYKEPLNSLAKLFAEKFLVGKYDYRDSSAEIDMPYIAAPENSQKYGIMAPDASSLMDGYSYNDFLDHFQRDQLGQTALYHNTNYLDGEYKGDADLAGKYADYLAESYLKNNKKDASHPLFAQPLQWYIDKSDGNVARGLKRAADAMAYFKELKSIAKLGAFNTPMVVVSDGEQSKFAPSYLGAKFDGLIFGEDAQTPDSRMRQMTNMSNYMIYQTFTSPASSISNIAGNSGNGYLKRFNSFLHDAENVFSDIISTMSEVAFGLGNGRGGVFRSKEGRITPVIFGASENIFGWNAQKDNRTHYYFSLFNNARFNSISFISHRARLNESSSYAEAVDRNRFLLHPPSELPRIDMEEFQEFGERYQKVEFVNAIKESPLFIELSNMRAEEIADYVVNEEVLSYDYNHAVGIFNQYMIETESTRDGMIIFDLAVKRLATPPIGKVTHLIGMARLWKIMEMMKNGYKGDGAASKFSELYSMMSTQYAKSLLLTSPATVYEGGLPDTDNIDFSYDGVRTVNGYRGERTSELLNPFKHMRDVTREKFLQTIIHEVAHVAEKKHDASFVNCLHDLLITYSTDKNTKQYIDEAINNFTTRYLENIFSVSSISKYTPEEIHSYQRLLNDDFAPEDTESFMEVHKGAKYLGLSDFIRKANEYEPAGPEHEYFYNSQSATEWFKRRKNKLGGTEDANDGGGDEARGLNDPAEEFFRETESRRSDDKGKFEFFGSINDSQADRKMDGYPAGNPESGENTGNAIGGLSTSEYTTSDGFKTSRGAGRAYDAKRADQSESSIRNIVLGQFDEFAKLIEEEAKQLITNDTKKVIEEIKVAEAPKPEAKQPEATEKKTAKPKVEKKKITEHVVFTDRYVNVEGYQLPIINNSVYQHKTIEARVARSVAMNLDRLSGYGIPNIAVPEIKIIAGDGTNVPKSQYSGKILFPVAGKSFDILDEATPAEINRQAEAIKQEYIDRMVASKSVGEEYINKLRKAKINYTVTSINNTIEGQDKANVFEALGRIPLGNFGYGVTSMPLESMVNASVNTYLSKSAQQKTFLAVPVLSFAENPFVFQKTGSKSTTLDFNSIEMFEDFLSREASMVEDGNKATRFKLYRQKLSALKTENEELIKKNKEQFEKRKAAFEKEPTLEKYSAYLDSLQRILWLKRGGPFSVDFKEMMRAEGFDRIDIVDAKGVFRGSHLIDSKNIIPLTDERSQSLGTVDLPDMIAERNMSFSFNIFDNETYYDNKNDITSVYTNAGDKSKMHDRIYQDKLNDVQKLARKYGISVDEVFMQMLEGAKMTVVNPEDHGYARSHTVDMITEFTSHYNVGFNGVVNGSMRNFLDRMIIGAYSRGLDVHAEIMVLPMIASQAKPLIGDDLTDSEGHSSTKVRLSIWLRDPSKTNDEMADEVNEYRRENAEEYLTHLKTMRDALLNANEFSDFVEIPLVIDDRKRKNPLPGRLAYGRLTSLYNGGFDYEGHVNREFENDVTDGMPIRNPIGYHDMRAAPGIIFKNTFVPFFALKKGRGIGSYIFKTHVATMYQNQLSSEGTFASANSFFPMTKEMTGQYVDLYEKDYGRKPDALELANIFSNDFGGGTKQTMSDLFFVGIERKPVSQNMYALANSINNQTLMYDAQRQIIDKTDKARSAIRKTIEYAGGTISDEALKMFFEEPYYEVLHKAYVGNDPVANELFDVANTINRKSKEMGIEKTEENITRYRDDADRRQPATNGGLSFDSKEFYHQEADALSRAETLTNFKTNSFVDYANLERYNYKRQGVPSNAYADVVSIIDKILLEYKRTGSMNTYIRHLNAKLFNYLDKNRSKQNIIVVRNDNEFADVGYKTAGSMHGDIYGYLSDARIQELIDTKAVDPEVRAFVYQDKEGKVIASDMLGLKDKTVDVFRGRDVLNQIRIENLNDAFKKYEDHRNMDVHIDPFTSGLDQTLKHQSPLISRIAKWTNYLEVPINFAERSQFFKKVYDIGELEVVRRVPFLTSSILRDQATWDSGIRARRFFDTEDGKQLLEAFKAYDSELYQRNKGMTKKRMPTMSWQEFYSNYKLNPHQIAFLEGVYRPALNEFIKVIREEDFKLFANVITSQNLYNYMSDRMKKTHALPTKREDAIKYIDENQPIRDAISKDIIDSRYAGWEDNVYFNSVRPVDADLYYIRAVKYLSDEEGKPILDDNGRRTIVDQYFTYYDSKSEFEKEGEQLTKDGWTIKKAYSAKDMKKLLVATKKAPEHELMQLALSANTTLDAETISALINASKRGIDIHKIHKSHIPGMKFTPEEFISQFESLVLKGINYSIRRNAVHKMSDIVNSAITDYKNVLMVAEANKENRSLAHQLETDVRYSIAYLNQIQINEKTYVDNVRNWTIAWHLGGFKPAFWLQQTLQPLQTVATEALTMLTESGNIIDKAMVPVYLAKNYNLAIKYGALSKWNPGKRFHGVMDGEKAEVMRALDYMDKLAARSAQELMGEYKDLDIYYGSFLKDKLPGYTKNLLTYMPRAIERYTRLVSALTFYDVGKRMNKSGDELIHFIADGIDRSMGEWGKGGRPAIVTSRVLSSTTERFMQAWAKAWITYKNFVFYNYSQYGHMMKNHAWGALATKLIVGTGLHGLKTFPMVAAMLWALSAFIEEDPDVEIYEAIKQIDEVLDTDFVGDILNQGLGSLVGVDLSQTLGEGSPVDMLANQYGDNAMEKVLLFGLGPVWSFAEGIGSGATTVFDYAKNKMLGEISTQDEVNKSNVNALKALPVFLKNMYRGAVEMPNYGIQVKGKTVIPPSDLHWTGPWLKAFSFRLSKETEAKMMEESGYKKQYNKTVSRLKKLEAQMEELELQMMEGSIDNESYMKKYNDIMIEQAQLEYEKQELEEKAAPYKDINLDQKELRKQKRISKEE